MIYDSVYITLGLVMWFLSALSILITAMAIWPFFRLSRRVLDLVTLVFLIVSLTMFVQFMAGMCGCLTRKGVLIISLLVGMSALAIARGQIKDSTLRFKDDIYYLFQLCAKNPALSMTLIIGFFAVAVRNLAHTWYLPPYIWDVQCYHLPKVADWIQNGSLKISDNPIARCYWPSGMELYQSWFMIFINHDAFFELAGLSFYFIAVASVYSMCRDVGGNRFVSVFMVLAFAATPALLLNSVSGKNDVAISALYLFIIALLSDALVSSRSFYRPVLLIFGATTIGMGIKASMAFVYSGIIIVGIMVFLLRWKKGAVVSQEKKIAKAVQIIFLSIVMSFSAYWYARNYFMFNNPFHPTDFRVMGKVVFGTGQGYGQQGGFSMESLSRNWTSLLGQRIFDGTSQYNPDLFKMGGWGWFAVAFIPISLYGLMSRGGYRIIFLGFFVSLLTLLGWVTPDPWNARFFTWCPAIIAVGSSKVLTNMRSRRIAHSMIVVGFVCIALNFLATISNGYLKFSDWKSYRKLSLFDRTCALNLDKFSPEENVIGYVASSNARIYPLYGKYLNYKIKHLKVHDVGDLPDQMQAENISLAYMVDIDSGWEAALSALVKDNKLEKVGNCKYALPANK